MKIKPLSLVKYDPSFGSAAYGGVVWMYLGEVVNMPGHAYLQEIQTGRPTILHTESLIVLTEEET